MHACGAERDKFVECRIVAVVGRNEQFHAFGARILNLVSLLFEQAEKAAKEEKEAKARAKALADLEKAAAKAKK